MRYLLFIVLLNCCSSNLLAQDFLIKSQSKDKDRTTRTHTLFNYDSTGFYALRFNKYLSYAELEHYDTLMNFKKAYVVTKKARKYIGVVNLNRKMYLLYFRYKKNKRENSHDKVSLYAKQLAADSFSLVSDSIELIAPFKMTSNYYRGNFAVSPDRTKVLVYDYEEEGDIDDVNGLTNEITLRVFDSSFKLLWKRSVNLSPSGGAKRTVAIKKLRVNNKGKVAILTDIFRDQRTYNSKKITADPTLFFVGKETNSFALFKPNMGEFFFNQSNFTFDSEGNILWFGFYSTQKYYQQRGVFFIKINKEITKVLVKKRHEFTKDQIAQLLNRKKINDKAEGRSYQLIHWRLTQEGGLALSAEQQPVSSYNFKSNHILALRFDAEGEIQWFQHIYKQGEQPMRQKIFLSHYMFSKGEDTYLLFNKGLYSDGFATAVKINSEGESRIRKFYTYERQQELFCPLLSFRLKGDKVFLCLQDHFFNNYRFALLDFDVLFKDKK